MAWVGQGGFIEGTEPLVTPDVMIITIVVADARIRHGDVEQAVA
jgi:hypothetical protein